MSQRIYSKTRLHWIYSCPLCISVHCMLWKTKNKKNKKQPTDRMKQKKPCKMQEVWCSLVYGGGVYVFMCLHSLSAAPVYWAACVCVCVCVCVCLWRSGWCELHGGSKQGSWRSGCTRWICAVQRPSLEGKQRNGEFDEYFWQCMSTCVCVWVCVCERERERVKSEPEKERLCVYLFTLPPRPVVSLTITPFFFPLFNFLTPSA